MFKLKKLMALTLSLSLSLGMSICAFAQESSSSIIRTQTSVSTNESLNARQSFNYYIPSGEAKSFYMSTSSTFDVNINFDEASSRFMVEILDDSGVIMNKVFDNVSTPFSYVDKSGYYSDGRVRVMIANDSSNSAYFSGSITLPRH